MEIPERFKRYFKTSTIPANPKEESTDTTLVLNQEYILDLLMQKESFFDTVTLLQPLRNSTIKSLNTLEKKGIINSNGITKGCKSCRQKVLVTVMLQLLKHIQVLINQLKSNNKLVDLGEQLRKFLNNNKRMIIHLSKDNGTLERIEF